MRLLYKLFGLWKKIIYITIMASCAWCYKKTNLPEVFAADGPLLEWMEERINLYCKANNINRSEIWGENSDWGKIDLSPKMEAELLAYDELVASVSRKRVCKECLIEDDKLFKKYYLKNKKNNNDDDLLQLNFEI